jgi:hypothetical protein
MGHRRFLQANHLYQKNKKAFDGIIKKRHAPKIHSEEHMFRMIKDLKVVFGKRKGGGSKKTKKAENNGNGTSKLLKKDQYFGTYHIGRI